MRGNRDCTNLPIEDPFGPTYVSRMDCYPASTGTAGSTASSLVEKIDTERR